MAFTIGCVYKDANDQTSVAVWVEELQAMGDDSPVILYKPQGVPPSDMSELYISASDFVLGLQTITQRRFMLQFGKERAVCLDSTHGTNQYDFPLVTMMVIDDFGQGNLVAFLISNKEDETTLCVFFRTINARLPDDAAFTSSHVMTDDDGQYYNARTAVFGPAAKLLCAWLCCECVGS